MVGKVEVGMAIFLGSGSVIAEIPWAIPMVAAFVAQTGLCVAFLALGRFQVLRDPLSFWAGLGFASLSVGHIFHVLAWPGLLPGKRSVIARLPNTPALITDLNLTLFGGFLLAAVLLPWPGKQALAGRRWLGVVAIWLFIVTLTFSLLVSFEQDLPVLVDPDGTFTPLALGLAAFPLLLFAAGSLLSTRPYLRSGDALAGYVAIAQTALVFIILIALLGGKRYDLWWYLQRMIVICVYLIIMFGLLSEYVRLLRRERESEQRYRGLFETMQEGLVVAEVITDELGNPVDYRYVDVNPATERQFGISRAQGERVIQTKPAFVGLEYAA
jgi:PAS domain-containing protein